MTMPNGGDLREARQLLVLENTPPVVDEHAGGQSRRREFRRVGDYWVGVDLRHVGEREIVEGLELVPEVRDGLRGTTFSAHGKKFAVFVFGLDNAHRVGAELAVIQRGWMAGGGVVFRVVSEIGGDQIGVAIPIEIRGGDSVPPAGDGW